MNREQKAALGLLSDGGYLLGRTRGGYAMVIPASEGGFFRACSLKKEVIDALVQRSLISTERVDTVPQYDRPHISDIPSQALRVRPCAP